MNPTPSDLDQAKVDSQAELAHLSERIAVMRGVLVRLLQDVVRAEAQTGRSSADELREANGQLLVAALLSRDDADSAFQRLDETTQTSQRDTLTQLPNRVVLLDRLDQAMAHANRHRTRLALLFIDLDNFKQINDSAGHAAGDNALRAVAQRLQATVRAADTLSRHGGDEFLVLLSEVAQPRDAALTAEKLIRAIAETDPGRADLPRLGASIGIALYPDDGANATTLIACADAAMYRAKRNGGGCFAFHGASAPAPTPSEHAAEHAADGIEPTLTVQQAQLREANAQLVLAGLDAQALQVAAEQAQQRQAEFVASLAQELRNPMAPIRIATAMLGRSTNDEPLMTRINAIVDLQMAQMARLLSDALVASGGPGGSAWVLERRVADLVPLIVAAIAQFRPVMAARQQHFESHLPGGGLWVEGDPARLAQIVGTLLDNASKHTQDGGRIALEVDVDTDATMLTLTVSDDGLGIAAAMLPQVFEPFVQDASAIGLHGGGLGIGLTAARALVQAHGGTIEARSAGLGQGSRFIVQLALVAPAVAP